MWDGINLPLRLDVRENQADSYVLFSIKLTLLPRDCMDLLGLKNDWFSCINAPFFLILVMSSSDLKKKAKSSQRISVQNKYIFIDKKICP